MKARDVSLGDYEQDDSGNVTWVVTDIRDHGETLTLTLKDWQEPSKRTVRRLFQDADTEFINGTRGEP